MLRLGGATSMADSDITAGSVHKEIHQPCGGFSLTLQPSQQYLSEIMVDDWITIKLHNGSSTGPASTMLGLVDRVALKTVVDGRGAEKSVIQVTGRDWGKALIKTSLVYDPVLGGGIVTDATIAAFATWHRADQNRMAVSKASEALPFFIDQFLKGRRQFALPRGGVLGDWLRIDSKDESKVAARINGLQNLNVSGALWSLLLTYSVPLFNELFTDWEETGPVLRLREYPFSRDAFRALAALKLPSTMVLDKDLGKSDADVRNWFRIFVDWEHGKPDTSVSVGNRIGYGAPASMRRHGLCRMEETTNGLFPFASPSTLLDYERPVPDQIELGTQKIAEWHSRNEDFYCGSFMTPLLPAAKVGMRLDYENEEAQDFLSFYLESVAHQFSFTERGGASTTTLGVTRGTPSDLEALLSFDELISRKELQTLTELDLWQDLASVAGAPQATWTPPKFY